MSVIYSPIRSPIRSPIYSAFGSGPSYDLDAIALFERFTTPADDTRKGLINDLIVALKAGGIWSKLDALYVMAAADAQAARRNWIADQYNLTAVSSPTFTADRGYTGDGATNYLDTGAAANAMSQYAADAAHIGAWVRTDVSAGAKEAFGVGGGTSATLLRPRDASNNFYGQVNGSTQATVASASTIGHFVAVRASASSLVTYRSGSQVASSTPGAGALAGSAKFTLLARNSSGAAYGGYYDGQISAAHFGGALDATQAASLHAALSTYLQAVGAT